MHLAKVENNLVSKAMFMVQKCKAKRGLGFGDYPIWMKHV
jgi:hypothetical protein